MSPQNEHTIRKLLIEGERKGREEGKRGRWNQERRRQWNPKVCWQQLDLMHDRQKIEHRKTEMEYQAREM